MCYDWSCFPVLHASGISHPPPPPPQMGNQGHVRYTFLLGNCGIAISSSHSSLHSLQHSRAWCRGVCRAKSRQMEQKTSQLLCESSRRLWPSWTGSCLRITRKWMSNPLYLKSRWFRAVEVTPNSHKHRMTRRATSRFTCIWSQGGEGLPKCKIKEQNQEDKGCELGDYSKLLYLKHAQIKNLTTNWDNICAMNIQKILYE